MKRYLTIISLGLLINNMVVRANVPTIIMSTTEEIGTNFSLIVSNSANNATIQVDWGDGSLVDYQIGTSDTTLTHTLAGNTIKIYGADLNKLDASEKKLTSLDVSGAANLNSLICSGNSLDTLDVSNNTALTYINCNRNALTSLDVTKNVALNYLECGENQLTGLDVTHNKELISLYCAWNSILNLKVLYNPKLKYLNCGSNKIHNLDLSNNTALISVSCYLNVLANLDLSNNTNLTEIHCSRNKLKKLILPEDSSLTEIHCYSNLLTELDLSGCPSLISLNDSSNLLTSMDLTNCPNLEELFCNDNQLTSLDISNCLKLYYLNCEGNNFTFETLPAFLPNLKNYFYGKQSLIKLSKKQFNKGDKVDLSNIFTKPGDFSFIWKTQNGAVLKPNVDYSDSSRIFTLLKSQMDSIYCQITNADFPGLILETEKVSVSEPTIVKEMDTNSALYPNPCFSSLTIKSVTFISKVEIYSISGNKVYESVVNRSDFTVPTDALPRGVLMVKLFNKEKVSIYKVIKR